MSSTPPFHRVEMLAGAAFPSYAPEDLEVGMRWLHGNRGGRPPADRTR